jgi:hypothetical protein
VEQAAASLQTESFGELIITEARLFSTPAADDAVFVTLTHLVQPLKCIQHLIPTQSKSYLLAACTSTENYSSQKRILQDMLNSFTIRAP